MNNEENSKKTCKQNRREENLMLQKSMNTSKIIKRNEMMNYYEVKPDVITELINKYKRHQSHQTLETLEMKYRRSPKYVNRIFESKDNRIKGKRKR